MGGVILDTRVSAGVLFDSLGGEEEREADRDFEVKGNPGLDEIVKGFEKFLTWDTLYRSKDYNHMLELITRNTSAKDIMDFSILLSKYQCYEDFDYRSGLYLSGLINYSSDNVIKINTNHLENLPDSIGYENNGKIIIINGNAGDLVGQHMSAGVIKVNKTGKALGSNMFGGKIFVNWAGIFIGDLQIGGNIYIKSDYQSISRHLRNGNIYHKSRQIIKDGKEVPGEEVRWLS